MKRLHQVDDLSRSTGVESEATTPLQAAGADNRQSPRLGADNRAVAKFRPEAPPMKRKAVITVEFDAEDYFSAQTQEEKIRRILSRLQLDFEKVDVRFSDRRPRSAPRAAPPQATWPRR